MRGGSISDFREKDGKRLNAEKKRRRRREEGAAMPLPNSLLLSRSHLRYIYRLIISKKRKHIFIHMYEIQYYIHPSIHPL